MSLLILSLFCLGLILGPLLGIAVDRTVDRLRFEPAHRCVHCETGLGASSLTPIVHWRQRCPNCERHKGWRYPAVDVVTGIVFALAGVRFGTEWMLAPYLALGAVLVVLSAIDLETHLLPNIIVWPSILAALFLVFVLSGQFDYADGIYSALLGAAVFGGFIGVAHIVNEAGMGRGDVKLAALLGLFVGWPQPGLMDTVRLVFYALFFAFLGGALVGMAYNIIRRRGRNAEFPFGPALAAGALAMIVLSSTIVGEVSP